MAVNRDRFLAMVKDGQINEGDEITITERTTYTVVSAGNGRVRLDRSDGDSHESLMLNAEMPSKRLVEAEFEVDSMTTPLATEDPDDDVARLRELMQQAMY